MNFDRQPRVSTAPLEAAGRSQAAQSLQSLKKLAVDSDVGFKAVEVLFCIGSLRHKP